MTPVRNIPVITLNSKIISIFIIINVFNAIEIILQITKKTDQQT